MYSVYFLPTIVNLLTLLPVCLFVSILQFSHSSPDAEVLYRGKGWRYVEIGGFKPPDERYNVGVVGRPRLRSSSKGDNTHVCRILGVPLLCVFVSILPFLHSSPDVLRGRRRRGSSWDHSVLSFWFLHIPRKTLQEKSLETLVLSET
jgi:hypothetical protein